MKPIQTIAILGAGAMGCLMGGLMQRAGYRVTYMARGTQLAALVKDGLILAPNGGEAVQMPVRAVAQAAEAGAQDMVVLCCKAHQLASMAAALAPLLHADTVILPAVNGVPFWYFAKHGGAFDGRRLTALDPDSVLETTIPTDRILGCVNYLAGSLAAPGQVQYVPEIARRIVVGELDGTISARLQAVGKVFDDAGFAPVLTPSIRQTVWHKLWGNIAFNPIGALTHGTIDQLAEGYRDNDLLMAVMDEARAIADRLGIELNQTTQSRIEAAAKMRGHKTSMQMDIEAGRATEIEAIVGAVREVAKWFEIGTPYLNTLYSLVKLKEKFYSATAGAGQA